MSDDAEYTCCYNMAGILKALGFDFDSKPEYAEKIPETLASADFEVHSTFRHGFPSQPTCLAYDPVQQLLAIGTEKGAILLLGKPGLERRFTHPSTGEVAVLELVFITNKGLLVSHCANNTLYLWSLREDGNKEPQKLHTLQFERESPTVISWMYGSDWLYVGTEASNVYLVRVESLLLSGYCIDWNKSSDTLTMKSRPGKVVAIHEHPLDQNKLLIGFQGGLCTIWNLRSKTADKRFFYDVGNSHILTSVSWVNNGKSFASSYTNGSIAFWNCKTESRPEKVIFPHECDPAAFKPIFKLQVMPTDSDTWFILSGGFPEEMSSAPKTITLMHSNNKSATLLSASSTILDFICLPSSPFCSDAQKPFALLVLTKKEIIVHDLQTPGYPCYQLPFALDLHHSPVTCVQYYGNCPEEFVASLHSVKSKIIVEHKSTKPWPLMGGKWGEESPHLFTDVIVTGHSDGSVRLWFCSSVIFQSFFTVNTSHYFKMRYKYNTKTITPIQEEPPPKKIQEEPPPKKIPPPRPPPPRLNPREQTDAAVTVEPSAEVASEKEKQGEWTQKKRRESKEKGREETSPRKQSKDEEKVTDTKVNEDEKSTESPETSRQNAPSPATGQHRSEDNLAPPKINTPSESDDPTRSDSRLSSAAISDCSTSPTAERRVVYPKEKKGGLFRKKSKVSRVEKDHISPTPTAEDKHLLAPVQEGEEDKQKRKSKISLYKIASKVKVAQKLIGGSGRKQSSVEDVDSTIPEKEDHVDPQEKPDQQDPKLEEPPAKAAPQQPDTIQYQAQPSATAAATTTTVVSPTTSQTSESNLDDWDIVRSKPTTDTPASPTITLGPVREILVENSDDSAFQSDEDVFAVCEIKMCVWGQWLCVANAGGSLLTFDFQLDEKETLPKSLAINFDNDSVLKCGVQNGVTPLDTPGWEFHEQTKDSLPGFRLMQHCLCYYSKGVPLRILSMQFSIDLGLLAIGTNRGLAVVDTVTNSCLHILSSLTSIQYMANPSKFQRQVTREASVAHIKRPTIKRHSTSWYLNTKLERIPSPPPSRSSTMSQLPKVSTVGSSEASVVGIEPTPMPPCATVEEFDCSVSSLELVQLLLDSKHTTPTLTLWVGTANGSVVAYGVNIVHRQRARRKIELLPTMTMSELKSPVVSLLFLSEWGDKLVVPYTPSKAHTIATSEGVRRPVGTPSQKPQNYAIIVDETKIRSFSFPGMVPVEKCTPPIDNNVILKSEYFMCKDLPCLLTLSSCRHMMVHSLPGLKPLMKVPYAPLGDYGVMYTFRVCGDGQALYMTSSSEIQRICITKTDRLNLPHCLPDVFTPIPDPQPVSKGIIGTIGTFFGGGPSEVDREDLFGVNAGRASFGLARADGRLGAAYPARRSRESRGQREPGQSDGGGRRELGAGAVGDQFRRNLIALDRRGQQLSDVERQTAELADNATDFASLASQLARKYDTSYYSGPKLPSRPPERETTTRKESKPYAPPPAQSPYTCQGPASSSSS